MITGRKVCLDTDGILKTNRLEGLEQGGGAVIDVTEDTEAVDPQDAEKLAGMVRELYRCKCLHISIPNMPYHVY